MQAQQPKGHDSYNPNLEEVTNQKTRTSSFHKERVASDRELQPLPRPLDPLGLSPSLSVQQNIAYILGALTAGGGTMGYVRTGSVPSIAAGVTVGLLYGLGGYRVQTRQPYGVELALLASVILGGSSIPRAIRLRKPVPVALSLISLFGLYTFGKAFRKTV
ncbi:transmembrane proteins 14C-domain-containing protein [Nemania sp. FL0916]|nr:transmembrane proteins 14C-domain-containing protein [Nemania sp. FL0916]